MFCFNYRFRDQFKSSELQLETMPKALVLRTSINVFGTTFSTQVMPKSKKHTHDSSLEMTRSIFRSYKFQQKINVESLDIAMQENLIQGAKHYYLKGCTLFNGSINSLGMLDLDSSFSLGNEAQVSISATAQNSQRSTTAFQTQRYGGPRRGPIAGSDCNLNLELGIWLI